MTRPGRRAARPGPARTAATEEFDGELVVYCERSQRMHCLDHRASVVWSLCDGTRAIDEVVRGSAEVLGVDAAAVRQDIEATIEEFYELGILR